MLDVSDNDSASGGALSRSFRSVAVVALLALHFGLAVGSSLSKSSTADEPAHLTSGVSHWKLHHFRLNPEGATLIQRWAALPVVLGDYAFVDSDDPVWTEGYPRIDVANLFFFELGNDLDAMLLRARSMIALLSVALGLAVYGLSRRLFGDAAGLLSLSLYALSPTVLANARLVTADLGAALFLFLSVWTTWEMLHRLDLPRFAVATLSVLGLMLAKMSGVLILPMAVAMLVVRWAARAPLSVRLPGRAAQQSPGDAPRTWGLCLAALVVMAAIVWVGVWGGYEFRYAGDPAAQSSVYEWESAPSHGVVPQAVRFAAGHRLLPEGFLYGFLYVYDYAQLRPAFLDGEVSLAGWRSYFVRSFLYKTPLPVFVLLALALAEAAQRLLGGGGRKTLYAATPLLVLFVVYGATSITTNLNIGHRHILPLYPVLFVFAGAAAGWLRDPRPWARLVVPGLVLWLAAASLWISPHYLAYFNPLAGGPTGAYRHLVDSSLDWGQDLPGLRDWLREERWRETGSWEEPPPIYLSYFGPTPPAYYGIEAVLLPGFPHPLPGTLAPRRLSGGVYAISASMLQTVTLRRFFGPWAAAFEESYLESMRLWRGLDATARDPVARRAFISAELSRMEEEMRARGGPAAARMEELMRQSPEAAWEEVWSQRFRNLSLLQLGRLAAYLRTREPDTHVGHSILIYFLSDAEVERALLGPPAQLAPHRMVEFGRARALMRENAAD